jgi:hypothetical protein
VQVIFRNDWFAPSDVQVKVKNLVHVSGKRFRKSDDPQTVPDSLKDFLPSSAVIVDEDGEPVEEIDDDPNSDLKAFDGDRAAAENEGSVDLNEVEAAAAKFQKELAEEKAQKKRGRPKGSGTKRVLVPGKLRGK